MSITLSSVKVSDPRSRHHQQTVDIYVNDSVIEQIGSGIKKGRVIDFSGKTIYPGFVDLFAHFNDPGFEQKEDLKSGSQCALSGGFTDVALIPNTHPVIESKSDVEYIFRSRNGVDLWPIAAVSEQTNGENLTEMVDLHHAGVRAFSDGYHPIFNSELLLKALQYTQLFDGVIMNRPKDQSLSAFTHMHEGTVSTILGVKGEPAISEELAINRDLDILRYAGGRIHFSMLSTAKSIELIRKAKKEGLKVTCDVAIHQLIYLDEALTTFDTNFKVDPPFRTKKDRQALWKGLSDGTIDAIVSAHLPQDSENKLLEFDLALPGVISLQAFYSNLLKVSEMSGLPMDDLIIKVSHNPRHILGLPSMVIEEKNPAKLAIVDKQINWEYNESTNQSKSVNAPEFNQKLIGKVIGVINGQTHTLF